MGTVIKVEATKAKSGFAKLPARARTRDVAITRHGQVKAYVLSPDRYQSLIAVAGVDQDALQKLDAEFEARVARMQSAAHRRAVKAIEALPLADILAAGALKPRARKRRARAA